MTGQTLVIDAGLTLTTNNASLRVARLASSLDLDVHVVAADVVAVRVLVEVLRLDVFDLGLIVVA